MVVKSPNGDYMGMLLIGLACDILFTVVRAAHYVEQKKVKAKKKKTQSKHVSSASSADTSAD